MEQKLEKLIKVFKELVLEENKQLTQKFVLDHITKLNIKLSTSQKKEYINRLKSEGILKGEFTLEAFLELNNEESENDVNITLAINDLIEHKNIFITGQAGTGKTFLVNKLINKMVESGISFAMCAPTGIAALNIGGVTTNKLFGFGISKNINDFKKQLKSNPKLIKRATENLSETDVIIIDEISMLGKEQFELIDFICKKALGSEEFFGGKQLIVTGDFLQLPPIKDTYAFESWLWGKMQFSNYHLTKVHRQDDDGFIEILGKIRMGKIDENIMDFLANKEVDFDRIDSKKSKLFTKNVDVDDMNNRTLESLPGDITNFHSVKKGKFDDSSVLAMETLKLKLGAKVMCLVNDSELRYVNGSIGIVKKIGSDFVRVNFDNGFTSNIFFHKWENKDTKGNVIGTFEQIPLKLAYAITIHKSQGQTIDGEMFIDLSEVWLPAQAYVALSRIVDHSKLSLKGTRNLKIKTDKKAVKFYEDDFKYESSELEIKSLSNLDDNFPSLENYIGLEDFENVTDNMMSEVFSSFDGGIDYEQNCNDNNDSNMLELAKIYEEVILELERVNSRKEEIRSEIKSKLSEGENFSNDNFIFEHKPSKIEYRFCSKTLKEDDPELYSKYRIEKQRDSILYIKKK